MCSRAAVSSSASECSAWPEAPRVCSSNDIAVILAAFFKLSASPVWGVKIVQLPGFRLRFVIGLAERRVHKSIRVFYRDDCSVAIQCSLPFANCQLLTNFLVLAETSQNPPARRSRAPVCLW
jgi:hypothetical protein